MFGVFPGQVVSLLDVTPPSMGPVVYRGLVSAGSVRTLKVSCPRARRFFKVFFEVFFMV